MLSVQIQLPKVPFNEAESDGKRLGMSLGSHTHQHSTFVGRHLVHQIIALSCYLTFCFLLASPVLSLAPNAPQDGTNLVSTVQPPVIPFNSSIRISNSSSTDLGDGPWIQCVGKLYGTPPIASCRDAVNQLKLYPWAFLQGLKSFGPRTSGRMWDFPMPIRHISCRVSFFLTPSDRAKISIFPLTDIHFSGWVMRG